MDRAEQTAQGATDKAAQHGVAHGSSNVLAVSRPQWGRLAGVMALVVIVLGALPFLKGGLVIAKHEGDTLHLADIVLRMAEFGQVPHLDFMTPLGVLSVAPIAWFVEAGINLGHAFFMAQLLVAVLLFVPAAYAAGTRLTMPWAALFGAYVMVLALALVHGEAQPAVSISMHYNRWAWAVGYVVILLALPPTAGEAAHSGARGVIEGVLIGLGMAVLGLLKATYAVALAPAIIVVLLVRGQGRSLLAALIAGLVVMGVATLVWGPAFWPAYVSDLLAVAGSETRAAPGGDLADIASAPEFFAGNLALLAGIVLLRRSERMAEGLMLLLLAPGFIYITYQNYGNDPQWLVLLALILLSARGSASYHGALRITGAVALAIGFGSLLNLTTSPIRHYLLESKTPTALITGDPRAADIISSKARLYSVSQSQQLTGDDSPYAAAAYVDPEAEPVRVNGEMLADCDLSSGFNAYFEVASRDLEGAGYGGSAVLAADLLGAFWLYGDFKPVEGSAPWYYAGASGIENADYVLVPICPTGRSQRKAILKGIDAAGWGLEEVRRTALYILFRPIMPK